jgi:RNA polymerase sigma factor (sigma-70 family)
MKDSRAALSDYVATGSEQSFREVVTSYVDLVYSSAQRIAGAALAEDITQTVFADLARLARTLSRDVLLGGWLHRRTWHVATTVMRNERRRQIREKRAMEMTVRDEPDQDFARLAPILDEEINRLSAEDRQAVVLRFLEQRNLRSVGDALGSSEDAAQKRVTRALGKLRALLERRGVVLSAAALASLLASKTATAAPAGLVASSVAAAMASAPSAGFTFTLAKVVTMTKLQVTVSALVAAGVATTVVLEYRANRKLRDEKAALEEQMETLHAEKQVLAVRVAAAETPRPPSNELAALQTEVGSLRRQATQLTALRLENQQLRSSLAEAAKPRPAPPVPDTFPRSTWKFAGYAEPTSAFQSTVWAMSQGDLQTFLDSLVPTSAEYRKWAARSQDEARAKMYREMEKVTGFRVVTVDTISDAEVVLGIHAEGRGDTGKFRLQRIGTDWKMAGPDRDKQ